MSDQERFDELSAAITPQRAKAHRLHSEWSYACKVLHDLEREQSALFRKMMDGPALASAESKAT